MMFDTEFLVDALSEVYDEGEDGYIVHHEQTGKNRWTSSHRIIFQYQGKHYAACYQRGLTELQEFEPFENDPDQIECPEVVQETYTATRWVNA